MTVKSKFIKLGKFSTPHGLRGQVKIISYTEFPEDIAEYGALFDSKGEREFVIAKLSAGAKGSLVAKIDGIVSREQAEALKGIGLYVERDNVPVPQDEDSFLIEDLVGLRVEQEDKSYYGDVCAVHNFGAGDLIEIAVKGSKVTEFYNFTKEIFPSVGLSNEVILFCPPETIQVIAEDAK